MKNCLGVVLCLVVSIWLVQGIRGCFRELTPVKAPVQTKKIVEPAKNRPELIVDLSKLRYLQRSEVRKILGTPTASPALKPDQFSNYYYQDDYQGFGTKRVDLSISYNRQKRLVFASIDKVLYKASVSFGRAASGYYGGFREGFIVLLNPLFEKIGREEIK